MENKIYNHLISPKNVLRGEKAWNKGKELIVQLSKVPLLLGRSKATRPIRNLFKDDLNRMGINVISAELNNDCCEIDLSQISRLIERHNCDAIIAAGGGKVLDSGKLLAKRLSLPCVTIPTSAGTCAGWTALSNIYSPQGAFIQDQELDSCPELLIFDYGVVRLAPARTLASGIADALAKWYEASSTSNSSTDGLVQQAVQMARVLRDQLFLDGYQAFKMPYSDEWIRVAEGCSLTAGLIGGVGGAGCRTAAAHAIHNGLTQLSSSKALHGEIVGFGILVQLQLEELLGSNQLAKQARHQLIKFFLQLNLPTSINDLGLSSVDLEDLTKVCHFSCKKESDLHRMPFDVNPKDLLEALLRTQNQKIPKTKVL